MKLKVFELFVRSDLLMEECITKGVKQNVPVFHHALYEVGGLGFTLDRSGKNASLLKELEEVILYKNGSGAFSFINGNGTTDICLLVR